MLLGEARKNDLQLHNINNRDLFYLLKIVWDKNIPKNEVKDNKVEGEAKGIVEEGFDFGLSENDILVRLRSKLDIFIDCTEISSNVW